MRFRSFIRGSIFGLCISLAAAAQTGPPEPVQWKATIGSITSERAGTKAIIALSGEVQPGWHIYALTQPAGGPIPLRITLDDDDLAQIRGRISGTNPTKRHDESFQLETQLYSGEFTLRVPVELRHPPHGKQVIPLSVRFQTCSDRTCLPPRTVHLSVPIDVTPGT